MIRHHLNSTAEQMRRTWVRTVSYWIDGCSIPGAPSGLERLRIPPSGSAQGVVTPHECSSPQCSVPFVEACILCWEMDIDRELVGEPVVPMDYVALEGYLAEHAEFRCAPPYVILRIVQDLISPSNGQSTPALL